MDDEKVDWSELPIELWPKIGKYLESHIEILRFRSVCELWRSSIPPSLPNSPSSSFPLTIPHPITHSLDAFLDLATIYLVHPTHHRYRATSSSSNIGFLIKVEESKSKNLPSRLLSPISDRNMMNHHQHPRRHHRSLGASSPILWNLLDYRVLEVSKSYTIKSHGFYPAVNKVVLFPNSCWRHVEDSVACCVFQEGRLGLMKHGDKKWSLVDHNNFYYDDVIVFKGQFYVTDKWGTISWVDISSSKLVQYSPPLCGFGNKKHLVESCGCLYVVDRYYESEPRTTRTRRMNLAGVHTRVTAVECFKVYKLDEEWGTWVNVNDLGDRLFILGNSCNFSVSAKDVSGYQANCIYFTDMFDVRMYNLQDGSIITIEIDQSIEKFLEEITSS